MGIKSMTSRVLHRRRVLYRCATTNQNYDACCFFVTLASDRAGIFPIQSYVYPIDSIPQFLLLGLMELKLVMLR